MVFLLFVERKIDKRLDNKLSRYFALQEDEFTFKGDFLQWNQKLLQFKYFVFIILWGREKKKKWKPGKSKDVCFCL